MFGAPNAELALSLPTISPQPERIIFSPRRAFSNPIRHSTEANLPDGGPIISPFRMSASVHKPFPSLPSPMRSPIRIPPPPLRTLNNRLEAFPSVRSLNFVPTPASPSPPAAPLKVYEPQPSAESSLTAGQLQQITNQYTTRNKAPYNHLSTVTVHKNFPRPPSPSTKLRRSPGRPENRQQAKVSRDARALKRATPTFCSTDFEIPSQFLSVKRPHFRAPGDEDIYESPAKRLAHYTIGESKRPTKTVKWDRGLVQEISAENIASPSRAKLTEAKLKAAVQKVSCAIFFRLIPLVNAFSR